MIPILGEKARPIATDFAIDWMASFIQTSVDNIGHAHGRDISPEQNAALARTANIMRHYTGDARYSRMASHAMKYLAAFAKAAPGQLHAEILLVDGELANAPIHITVVGSKADPAARELHSAALRYPSDYLQIDWWDHGEGRLPNPEIQYPQLDRAAAFVCTATGCSMPVFGSAEIEPAVRSALSH